MKCVKRVLCGGQSLKTKVLAEEHGGGTRRARDAVCNADLHFKFQEDGLETCDVFTHDAHQMTEHCSSSLRFETFRFISNCIL